MADKWNNWYKNLTQEQCGSFVYGDTETYKIGYTYLNTCDKIEDWGCGAGGFKRFFLQDGSHKYSGVDGSETPFADIKTDLINYQSNVEGIYMRHVLEHNYEWKQILENACQSFTKKMCLVLFTPFNTPTKEIAHNLKHGVDVPDLSLDKNELLDIFKKYNIQYKLITLITNTGYNIEHVFFLDKENIQLKLAFYTCFYGSNQNLSFKIPKIPSLKYDCYYYTNNKYMLEQLKNTKWIGMYDNKTTHDDLIESCMIGKHIKTMSHEYNELNQYDYLCFLDSKLNYINEEFVEEYIQRYFIEKNYCLLLRNHWYIGNNIWEEYNESMSQKRYIIESEKYKKYIYNQLSNGLKETTDYHCACGFLIKNMKHEKTIELNTTWFKHIQECGIQDQISFFFVKQLFNNYIHSFSESPFIDV